MKARFYQRIVAYIIDIIIISFFLSLIMILFPLPEKTNVLSEKLINISEKLIVGEIELESYVNQFIEINYEIDFNRFGYEIITFVIYILYFIVYQFYNNGQTIGKKLMRIKIVNNNKTKSNSELSLNDLAKRSLIINGLLMAMITLTTFFLVNKEIYFYINTITGLIQLLIVLISSFMILYRKDGQGLHDIFANTTVIANKKENE